MSLVLLSIGFAVFIWWFSTGAVIYLDNLPNHTFKWTMAGASLITVGAFYGVWLSAGERTSYGVLLAFSSALLVWAWIEVSFYTGYVTGLSRPACEADCSGWRHLGHAIETSLYHELAIIAFGAILFALTYDSPNQIGLWTYVVLWWMHQSAKLNVLLGVPNLSEEFLPDHLTFIRSFLRKKPMNLFFPISVTVSTLIAFELIMAGLTASAEAADSLGFALLATIMVLAILEHWFLVLPLPSAFLWNWGLSPRQQKAQFSVEIAVGYLGAGKTTLINRLLADGETNGRTIVLVNDFSKLGLDGSLLQGRGANIIELANGCICCSLAKDLGLQLQSLARNYSPRRVLIEPSGVADVVGLLRVLTREDIRPLVTTTRIYSLFDAGQFLADFARMPDQFEAQIRLGSVLVINKIDLVTDGQLRTIQASLRTFNPQAEMILTTYGNVSASQLRPMIQTDPASPIRMAAHFGKGTLDVPSELTSWSSALAGNWDPDGLHAILDNVVGGAFGDVERVKGIARSGNGWVRFDVAGGRSSVTAFAPRIPNENPRVLAIGRGVDEIGLRLAFGTCAAATIG
jgi:putative photosynthetic complex assembly protein 2